MCLRVALFAQAAAMTTLKPSFKLKKLIFNLNYGMQFDEVVCAGGVT